MSTATPTRGMRALPYAIFVLSGAVSLGFEIVWIRTLAVGLGHEIVSTLAVISGFFAGLALGAFALDRRISTSRFPGRWYAGLELLIAAWGLITVPLLPWVNELVPRLCGADPGPVRHWAIAFAVPFVVLLPATAAMGATLTAMDRCVSRLRSDGRVVAGLYAANTLGAVSGTLLATFVLVPELGLRSSSFLLAAGGVVAAVAMLTGPARAELERLPKSGTHVTPHPDLGWLALAFLTGVLGIAYEVTAVRVMAQVLEDTVYTFASLLAVYLLGTAAGAAAYQRWKPQNAIALMVAVSLTVLLSSAPLAHSKELFLGAWGVLGGGMSAAILAELVLAAVVFAPPAFAMGMVFSHIVQSARGDEHGVGRVYGLNTVGGAFAPLLFGVVAIPALGSKAILCLIGAAYAVLAWLLPHRSASRAPLIGLACGGLVLLLPFDLLLLSVAPDERIRVAQEGVMATVAVIETDRGNIALKVNDRFTMGDTSSAFGEGRQAHVPLLLHPAPRSALFLGLGTGITFAASTTHPDLDATGIELVPEVVAFLPYFDREGLTPEDRGLTVRVSDARRFAGATGETFDVIVADLFHPGRDGAGALYTREHFAAVRSRLAPGGLFCQWLPLHQMDMPTLRTVLRTFLDVFPEAQAHLAHFNAKTPALGVIGRLEPHRYATPWTKNRLENGLLRRAARNHALDDDLKLFGTFVAGRNGLAELAGDGLLNTDDRPIVAYEAPRVAYDVNWKSYATIDALLDAVRRDVSELLHPGDAFGVRLERYVAARDVFLRAGMRWLDGDIDAAVDGYLESLRTDPGFGPAIATALTVARRLEATDEAEALRIEMAVREAIQKAR